MKKITLRYALVPIILIALYLACAMSGSAADYNLDPTADSYVYGGSASSNYGTAVDLIVKDGSGTTYDRMTYLKFDLSGISGTISSATLKLYCNKLENGAPAIAKAFTVASDSWTETGITWNNAPATGSQAGDTLSVEATGTWYSIDVTSYIASEHGGDQVASICLKDDTQCNKKIAFDSREATNKPKLEVTIAGGTPTPSPTPTPPSILACKSIIHNIDDNSIDIIQDDTV